MLPKYLHKVFKNFSNGNNGNLTDNDKPVIYNKPTLNGNQVAVLAADGATGHVLNTEKEVFHNDSGESIYWIFDSYTSAQIFIEQQQLENDWIEFTVYNSLYELLDDFEALKWKDKQGKQWKH